MLRPYYHQIISYSCILAVAFLLPLSVWLVTAVSILIILNWIAEGNYREKIKIFTCRPELLLLPALFILYLLWLANTTDFSRAATELRLKLPIIIFPLFASSQGLISESKMRAILLSFITGCIIAVMLGYAALAGIITVPVTDSRDLALFVPSIRLSIMVNLAIFSSMYLSLQKNTGGLLMRASLVVAAAVMVLFLFSLLSVTGLLIFIICAAGTALYLILKHGSRMAGVAMLGVAAISVIVIYSGMTGAWQQLHNPADPEVNTVTDTTPSGNRYISYPDETLTENGYLVWNNVCEEELRRGWNSRSTISYDSADLAGNELRVTLIRYITFLGMRKDSSAVAALTPTDVKNIESGFANPLYADIGSPQSKWYEIAWQADRHLKGGNPSGHSVTQRLEFYRAAIAIIRENAFTGVGTGDVRKAFDREYAINKTPLTQDYRLMAHNQYLTFAITFGMPGALLALLLMIVPFICARKRAGYIFSIFISIIFISMFNDDTFESATGATFFSYFYTLFLLIENRSQNDE